MSCISISAGSQGQPTQTGALSISLWQDYVYLDVSERSSVASEAQEQVIDLVRLARDGLARMHSTDFGISAFVQRRRDHYRLELQDQASEYPP